MSPRQKLVWVAALYFAEGFPFGLVMDAIPVYLRLQGVSLADIGLLGLVGLPWTLKFLWAPAVDVWGHRRTWVWVCQALMGLPLIVLAGLHAHEEVWILWSVLILLAVLSATQDIAIDAYTIELLEKHEMGVANGVRVTAYRLALIAAGGVVVAAARVAGWGVMFIGAAVLMGLLSMISSRAPLADAMTSTAQPRPPRSAADAIRAPLEQFFARPGFLAVAAFVLTFKRGDMAIGPMIKAFCVRRPFPPVQIRSDHGTLGVVATEGMGYAAYFTATFFLAWPAFLLLPWVKDWAGNGQEKGEGP